ncbi:MAG: hypothetical protein FWC50_14815 [Planctomycetaceae bacterium]|nr:hypothetical protein [Planctomycetaceae bacterium]
MLKKNIVITGMGLLSPIGNDPESYWNALCEGRSGVGVIQSLHSDKPFFGSEVPDIRAKDYVKPRKNIKVMSRDIQLGYVAAAHAIEHAGLITLGGNTSVPPERLGIVYGSDLIGLELDELMDAFKICCVDGKLDFSLWGTRALEKIYPLWMMKYLPNLVAGQMAIAIDARGPNNTLTLRRCSSLAAITEAARTIERGQADVMLCGGVGNRVNPLFLARGKTYEIAPVGSDPSGGNAASHPRPYDADRTGGILGEGAGALVIETEEAAKARGARLLARIIGFAATIEPKLYQSKVTGIAIRTAIRQALRDADCKPEDLSHVNADGLGTVWEDQVEAQAIRAELGDVPVISPKGSYGDLGSGSGTIELIASILGLQKGLIPPTCNFDKPDPNCPIDVVHGSPRPCRKKRVLTLNHSRAGRSNAMVIEAVQ